MENSNNSTNLFDTKTKLENDNRDNINNDALTGWDKCLDIIKDNVDKQVYKTWFKPLKPLSYNNDQLVLSVPSQFFYEWIEENFYDLLQKSISKVFGDDIRIQYQVAVKENEDSLESRAIKVRGLKYPRTGSAQSSLPFEAKEQKKEDFKTNLNPKYVFDNFITGESNQLASSAAMAIATNPGKTKFNPLVLYGDTGLGKTHLVQAIGNSILQTDPDKHVYYTDSDKFTMEFINCIQNNKVADFVKFYRSVDVLIVDDIQFFAGKEKTQDNFFHTFNALYQSGKQLILTSDKPPRDLSDVDERLISRFQWGLTVDVQPPDLEMRMAIFQRKSSDEGFELPMPVVEYLAKNVKSNIREIEGTLISLIAKVTFDQRPITVDLAKEVVHGVAAVEKKPLTIDDIKEVVATYYKLSIEQLESKSRKHEIALARQMSMYLAKQLTQLSLKSIGSHFGGRDHSTVLHSCTTIENYLVTDKAVKNAYEYLHKLLKDML